MLNLTGGRFKSGVNSLFYEEDLSSLPEGRGKKIVKAPRAIHNGVNHACIAFGFSVRYRSQTANGPCPTAVWAPAVVDRPGARK